MKKTLSAFLALVLALSLAACGGPAAQSQSPSGAVQTSEPPSASEGPAPELTLNTGGIKFSRPGDTFLVELSVDYGEITAFSFECEDDLIASAAPNGTVTGLRPGSTTLQIEVTAADAEGNTHRLAAQLPVVCDWEEPSEPPSPQPSEPSSPQPPEPSAPPDGRAITLSHSDVTLKSAGASFTLSVVRHAIPDDAAVDVKYVSSDESVATVDKEGVVTAVAPGRAVITVTATAMVDGSSRAWTPACIVRCRWEIPAEPSAAPSVSVPPVVVPGFGPGLPSQSPEPSQAAPEIVPLQPMPAGSVDLSAFFSAVSARHEFPGMDRVGDEYLVNLYPGLTAIPACQRVVYAPAISFNTGEIALVQTADRADAAAVKAVFQSRADRIIATQSNYIQVVEIWENARIVTNGNYVMLVASPDAEAIVSEFNALF